MRAAKAQLTRGDLQTTVSMLQEELQATNREVLQLTLELEQRVADRTAELAQANHELRKEIAERLRAETEIKQLNKDLTHRAELLLVANQELEAFSSSVSHDLRNPLSLILGYASLLETEAIGNFNESGTKYVARICAAGHRMSALIDDLLRLSHSAQAQLDLRTVDLAKLLDNVLMEQDREVQSRKIVWIRGALPVVTGDASLLFQVLTNLVSNAIKYSRTRNPSKIEIGCSDKVSGEWQIYVRDNGVGFDSGKSGKLFGAFQRLHKSEEFEGTGIGLANVRRIILRHNGRVWAESEPGQGATFYFSLPAHPNTAGT